MKKHLFLAAFAAVSGLMTSCSDDDLTSSIDTSQSKTTIAFSAGKNNQSRSGVTITSLDKFTVTSVNPDNTIFFDGEQFTYADGVFKSSTPHYWPTTGTLSFYAISDVGENTFTEANVPQYTYTGWTAEKDLVAATAIAGEKEIPYPLTFQHLTSQVIISAEAENKTEELTYKLVSVEMTAPSTGIYSFADATGGTGTWSINNDQTTTYTFEEALPMSFAQNASNKLDNCYWNILPVTDGKLYFRVEYQVFQNGKIISDFTGDNYKECTVENPNLQSGKIYTYNFILTRGTNSEITFTTTVNEWSDGNTTSITLGDPVDNIPVDLALPSGLKWAMGNIGATDETQKGLFFQWGETTGHAYGVDVLPADNDSKWNDYISRVGELTTDLTLANDAASVYLGGNWRMPSEDDFNELVSNCNIEMITDYNGTGVAGGLFTSKINGKTIFIPATNTALSGMEYGIGDWIGLWTSTICPNNYESYHRGNFFFGGGFDDAYEIYPAFRFEGFPIRAVCN